MAPMGQESRDYAAVSVANLTDHMLGWNEKNLIELIKYADQLDPKNIMLDDVYRFTLGALKILRALLVYSSGNPTTAQDLCNRINDLIDEVMDPPEIRYAPLAEELLKRLVQSLNQAMLGDSALKQNVLVRAIIDNLSKVSLLKERTMMPESLLNTIKSFQKGDDL
jgi:hypothetical protein